MKKNKNIILILFAFVSIVIFTLIYFIFLRSQKFSIEVNGIKREYLIHIPKSQKMPLVIALHGYKDNPRLMEFYTGLSTKADKEKFVVVYPYGTKNKKDNNLSWNGGSCCGNGVLKNIDDVAFINNLTDELIKKYDIDPERIYITGFSNGGLLVYRIASESPDRYKGFAIVSGSIGGKVYKNLPDFEIQKPKKSVSILVMHGISDTRIPFEGGLNSNKDGTFKSFKEAEEFWSKYNECRDKIKKETNIYSHISYQECKDKVKAEFYALKNSGHVWPGGILEVIKNFKNQSLSATDIIWEFFNK